MIRQMTFLTHFRQTQQSYAQRTAAPRSVPAIGQFRHSALRTNLQQRHPQLHIPDVS